MAAITWLKENNPLYSVTELSDEWDLEWMGSQFLKLFNQKEENNVDEDTEQNVRLDKLRHISPVLSDNTEELFTRTNYEDDITEQQVENGT